MGEFFNMLHSDFMEPQFYIMFYTVVFLFGICIGSFLNVVIFRVPKNESLIKRSSHSMTCGAKIRVCDLIPIFSWIFLRGKCHNCGEKISPRYPIVESLNGLLYVLTFYVMDFNAESIITCVLMSMLIVIGFIDWDTMEIDLIMVGIVLFLSAGRGMVYGVTILIPACRVGHIGLYRDPVTLNPVEYYCKLPADAQERELIVLDPMLATGGSASAAISFIKKRGCSHIRLVNLIAAPEGIKRMQEDHPDGDIYVACMDDHLNEHGYIVPGLGDAGDRLFGTK